MGLQHLEEGLDCKKCPDVCPSYIDWEEIWDELQLTGIVAETSPIIRSNTQANKSVVQVGLVIVLFPSPQRALHDMPRFIDVGLSFCPYGAEVDALCLGALINAVYSTGYRERSTGTGSVDYNIPSILFPLVLKGWQLES